MRRRKKQFLIIPFILALLTCLSMLVASASVVDLPARIWNAPNGRLALLDWERITLSSLPAIQSTGEITKDKGISRSWKVSQTPDQFLQVVDISSPLSVELLSLEKIYKLTSGGQELRRLSLAKFPLIAVQTVEHLVEVVPKLGRLPVSEVAPINALADGVGEANLTNQTIASAVRSQPLFAHAALGNLPLQTYALTSIPNLTKVPLGAFLSWHSQLIKDIPNLNVVPLSSFPNPVKKVGQDVMKLVAIQDELVGNEKVISRTISGSDVAGFDLSCNPEQNNCAYLGLAQPRRGKADISEYWIGGTQEVTGGRGCLAQANDQKEPTGRHPYGSLFKLVIANIDGISREVEASLYFRFANDCGFTPYFVGPVVVDNYRVGELIFVGSLHQEPTTPQAVAQQKESPLSQGIGVVDSSCSTKSKSTFVAEINTNLLSAAIATVADLDRPPDLDEVVAEVQAVSRDIDPTTSISWKGERLIERVGQRYFGGRASVIDADFPQLIGKQKVLAQYAKEVLSAYQEGLSLLQSCGIKNEKTQTN